MVEVVVPLGIEAKSSKLSWADESRVVQGTFCNEINLAMEPSGLVVNGQGQLL